MKHLKKYKFLGGGIAGSLGSLTNIFNNPKELINKGLQKGVQAGATYAQAVAPKQDGFAGLGQGIRGAALAAKFGPVGQLADAGLSFAEDAINTQKCRIHPITGEEECDDTTSGIGKVATFAMNPLSIFDKRSQYDFTTMDRSERALGRSAAQQSTNQAGSSRFQQKQAQFANTAMPFMAKRGGKFHFKSGGKILKYALDKQSKNN